ncbi:MAG: M48 family metallopeptidase, partial [Hydrogenophaga sp.]
MEAGASAVIRTQWFDGRSPRGRSVTLQVLGDELLLRTHDGLVEHRYPLSGVRWPERRSHGQRQTGLPDGGLIQHASAAEWDAWFQASGLREGAVVGWMQSWRATFAAMAGTVVFLAAAWVWGVPWLSTTLARLVPQSLENQIGEQSLAQLDRLFLKPSQLPAAQQEALRQRFARVVETAHPEGDAPAWQLAFHQSEVLGANAFALPGGSIVMTDDLVALLDDQP